MTPSSLTLSVLVMWVLVLVLLLVPVLVLVLVGISLRESIVLIQPWGIPFTLESTHFQWRMEDFRLTLAAFLKTIQALLF